MTMHLENRLSMINTKKRKVKITKAKMKELEANILEYQKIIPDVMDSKTRIVRTKGSVKTQKLNDYGIPIPDSEDFS